jgi:hypothetical protein
VLRLRGEGIAKRINRVPNCKFSKVLTNRSEEQLEREKIALFMSAVGLIAHGREGNQVCRHLFATEILI